jgi:cysteine desulfuration protein SufE
MKKTEIENKLSLFDDDWPEKYRYIIGLGRDLPLLPDEYKIDLYKVDGCISQVWLKMEISENKILNFNGDSDSMIVKGLVAILKDLLSGRPAKEILGEDIEAFFHRVGLSQHISINRRNGFFSMVRDIKRAAAVLESVGV